MTGPACLREFKTHAVRHQNIQHAPQQMRAPPPSDRIKDDDQPFGLSEMDADPCAACNG
jgi:hypothetical protein